MATGGYIELPWPPRALHPNARPHLFELRRTAKIYRESAYWLAKAGELAAPASDEIMVSLVFHPPSNRGDTDGMFAAIKSGLDGIADAMEVNDRRFAFTIHRREPVKAGKVVVTIT